MQLHIQRVTADDPNVKEKFVKYMPKRSTPALPISRKVPAFKLLVIR
jgi:hypothetical protein